MIKGCVEVTLTEPIKQQFKKKDAFWQKLILPEEDRRRLFPTMPWTGSYRWFRSPNVICLEQHRRQRDAARIANIQEKGRR
jgi:hypothetical protein